MVIQRVLGLLLLGSAFLVGGGCSDVDQTPATDEDVASADDPSEARDYQAHLDRGERLYLDFCASCHGSDGAGDGPVAEFLSVPLPDLTRLAEANGGVYPAERVHDVIEGTNDIGPHGTREMPVWGNVWAEDDGRPVTMEVVEERINELVEYLRTIQSESDDTLSNRLS